MTSVDPLPHRYPLLTPRTAVILGTLLAGRRRSFARDAQALIGLLKHPFQVEGPLPRVGKAGGVIIINHYSRPGFGAWWIAIAVTAALGREVHWALTSEWVYADRLRATLISPLSRWVLRRVALGHGFTAMPPMPPRPQDFAARATAVRDLLRFVDREKRPLLALAPEGADSEGGALQRPPAGVGRLLAGFVDRGLKVFPAGIYEDPQALHLRFQEPVRFPRQILRSSSQDRDVGEIAMRAIAACLPPHLRGPFDQEEE